MSGDDYSEQLALFDLGGVDLSALRARRESLRGVSRAASTVEAYASDWRLFSGWCASAGRLVLPASGETVSLYVTWLLEEEGRKVSTAERHVSAIAHYHRRGGHASPVAADVREILAAVRRKRRERPRGKCALDARDLVRVVRACDAATLLGSRDRALIVLGFATSLRRSELAGLQLSDVSFEREGLAVLVRHGKRDQEGRGRVIAVWSGRRAVTDPVRVLRGWLRRRGRWDGPLFCRVQTGDFLVRDAIRGQAVSDAVKRAVAAAGLDPAGYSAHSLRAGAITASAELGRSDQEIMCLSGHVSASVMRGYIRRSRMFGGRNPLAGVL